MSIYSTNESLECHDLGAIKKKIKLWSGQTCFDYGAKSTSNKSKNRRVQLHQTEKSFCIVKEMIKRVKRQLTESEKIFADIYLIKG